MKSFSYNFSLTLKILIWSAIAVSIVGLVWNIFNLIEYVKLGTIKIVTYSIMVFLNVFLTIFALSVIAFSRYEITDDYLICRIGLLKSKCKLSDIVEITHYVDKKVLAVYFSDEKFNLISINCEKFIEFADYLKEKNNKIYFDIQRNLDNIDNSKR